MAVCIIYDATVSTYCFLSVCPLSYVASTCQNRNSLEHPQTLLFRQFCLTARSVKASSAQRMIGIRGPMVITVPTSFSSVLLWLEKNYPYTTYCLKSSHVQDNI